MKYDIAIIGGGPAGMMAGIRAGILNKKVILLEKNPRLGVKLLITGKGRCNISNNTLDIKSFISHFGNNGKFLFSSLHNFGVNDTIDFFEELGVKTKIERGERIFPQSDRSFDVLASLVSELKRLKVEIRTNSPIKDVVSSNNKINKIILFSGEKIEAKNYIISTGGKSYPETGSSGDGYKWLKKMGHTINPPSPALVPILIKEDFIKQLEGLSLKNVEIGLFENNKKIESRFGEALFTANGMSGPIILDLSKFVNLKNRQKLMIDFKPALDNQTLDQRIQNDFKENNNKQFRNSLAGLLPQKLIPLIVWLAKIDPEKQVNLITKEERGRLLQLLKNFELEIRGIGGFDKAIVTSGGVSLTEINPKTMQSKLIDNLFLAGEILDLDGPTGGFNLQVCWSTGYTAGEVVKS